MQLKANLYLEWFFSEGNGTAEFLFYVGIALVLLQRTAIPQSALPLQTFCLNFKKFNKHPIPTLSSTELPYLIPSDKKGVPTI